MELRRKCGIGFQRKSAHLLVSPHSDSILRLYWRAVRRKTLRVYLTNRAEETPTRPSGCITFAGLGLRPAMELATGRKVVREQGVGVGKN